MGCNPSLQQASSRQSWSDRFVGFAALPVVPECLAILSDLSPHVVQVQWQPMAFCGHSGLSNPAGLFADWLGHCHSRLVCSGSYAVWPDGKATVHICVWATLLRAMQHVHNRHVAWLRRFLANRFLRKKNFSSHSAEQHVEWCVPNGCIKQPETTEFIKSLPLH